MTSMSASGATSSGTAGATSSSPDSWGCRCESLVASPLGASAAPHARGAPPSSRTDIARCSYLQIAGDVASEHVGGNGQLQRPHLGARDLEQHVTDVQLRLLE